MGEVYRARDTKLNRDVAVKILPEGFALDSERVARFQREAQVLASLNHPNIAAIYGLEESGGVRALVLELVEGPTLAEVIAERRASGSALRRAPDSALLRFVQARRRAEAATFLPDGSVHSDTGSSVSRRAMDRVYLERVGTLRGVRAEFPNAGW